MIGLDPPFPQDRLASPAPIVLLPYESLTSASIILLGPPAAGKSAVGKLLASQTGLPLLHLRSIDPAPYLKEAGYDEAAMRQSRERGWEGFYRYMQPFQAHLVERILPQLGDCVLELSAQQAAFDDPELLGRVQCTLEPYRNVVLLLPSPDLDESTRVLGERQQPRVNGVPIDEHFVKHHSNHELAKQVVYTKGKTPEETCEEILARVDPSSSEIILIGPMRAGKSTLGRLLAERLERPQVPMDERRWAYYQEFGWERQEQQRIAEGEGFGGVYRYWKPFELHAVERLLSEHRDCVIDFGAGHSVYEDEGALARAKELLAPYANVVLLLPSPDLDESVPILRERSRATIAGIDLNRFFSNPAASTRKADHLHRGEESGRDVLRRNGKGPSQVALLPSQALHPLSGRDRG